METRKKAYELNRYFTPDITLEDACNIPEIVVNLELREGRTPEVVFQISPEL